MSLPSPSHSTVSTSGSGSTPTSASASTVTPASYAASSAPTTATTSRRPYPLSASQLDEATRMTSETGNQLRKNGAYSDFGDGEPEKRSRIPVTPAVLRGIFASSRTPGEERGMSRVAFFRFSGFLLSCLVISLVANRGRSIRGGAALLGVSV